jgi:MerR family copper efflux transcriptional regulator
MADMKELLSLWRNRSRSSAGVKRLTGRQLADLRRKIAELEAWATLEHLMRHCHADQRTECPVLDELAKR